MDEFIEFSNELDEIKSKFETGQNHSIEINNLETMMGLKEKCAVKCFDKLVQPFRQNVDKLRLEIPNTNKMLLNVQDLLANKPDLKNIKSDIVFIKLKRVTPELGTKHQTIKLNKTIIINSKYYSLNSVISVHGQSNIKYSCSYICKRSDIWYNFDGGIPQSTTFEQMDQFNARNSIILTYIRTKKFVSNERKGLIIPKPFSSSTSKASASATSTSQPPASATSTTKSTRILKCGIICKSQCDVCGQWCANQRYLDDHMRKHTGEKPFQCGICGREFPYKRNLKRHKIIHTGARDYKCTICGNPFRRFDSLKNHMEKHRRN